MASPKAQGPTKILVVEDEPDIARAIVTYGLAKGYSMVSAGDGLTALDMVRKEQPAVMLLDISLPGMDGRDVYKTLEKEGLTKDLVVIFVTARDSHMDRLVGLELGAADYETKPIHFQLLFQRIRRLLEKKREGEI